jgi:hypothetical protein
MFGFIFGTACLVGLAVVAARGRRGRGFRRHGGFRRWGTYWVFERLETTPAQEKAILGVIDSLREKARDFATSARDSRKDVASAFRGSAFDESAFAALFDGHLGAIGDLRDEFAKAASLIHETLTDNQRRRLAEILESGPRWGWGYGHHGHGHC